MSNTLPSPNEMTLTEAAFRLRLAYPLAYRKMFSGELNGRRIGTRWYVAVKDVERVEAERAPLAQPA
jgi:hypothetical protein